MYREIESALEGFGWFVHISAHPREAAAWLAQLKKTTVPLCFLVESGEEERAAFAPVISGELRARNVAVVPVRVPK